MRVTQSKNPNIEKPVAAEPKAANEDGEEAEGDSIETIEKVKEPQLLISGAPARGDKDFTEQAVKSFHETKKTDNKAFSIRDANASMNQHNNSGSHQVHQPRGNNH